MVALAAATQVKHDWMHKVYLQPTNAEPHACAGGERHDSWHGRLMASGNQPIKQQLHLRLDGQIACAPPKQVSLAALSVVPCYDVGMQVDLASMCSRLGQHGV